MASRKVLKKCLKINLSTLPTLKTSSLTWPRVIFAKIFLESNKKKWPYLFLFDCAAIINRTIDHHRHCKQNDHVLNIQTASITYKTQGHRLYSACRFQTHSMSALVYSSSSSFDSFFLLSTIKLPPHCTCYMPLISFKGYGATYHHKNEWQEKEYKAKQREKSCTCENER